MDHLCALQRDFINLRLGTFIHWNSAAVQFHANPDIIDWEFDLENGGEPRRYPFPESDWAPRAPDCDRQSFPVPHQNPFCSQVPHGYF